MSEQETNGQTALAVRDKSDLAISFVVTTAEIKERIKEIQDFVADYMIEGEDFGTIPGTPKPTLYKPGAEKLCDVYGFTPLVEVTNRVEDWEKGFFHYEVRAVLESRRNGMAVAQGLGSCNSKEARYRWRNLGRKCPACGAEQIIKGKEDYGGGWLCWKKNGGCGAKFKDGDNVIESQQVGKIENDDSFSLVNTILKMAKKRALVDAVLSATRSSGLFTQDMEDGAPSVDGQYREVHTIDDVPFEPVQSGQFKDLGGFLTWCLTEHKLSKTAVEKVLGGPVDARKSVV